jgi:formylglycine-generating enzyme required for sulfatase activity
MKKRFFIAFYIFWISILIYIFIRLIQPPVSENSNSLALSNQPSIRWVEPKSRICFLKLPEGCFYMGSSRLEINRSNDEGPLHRVCLDSFWISEHEITVRQFHEFVRQTDYQTQAEQDGFSWAYDGEWKKRSGLSWKNPGFSQTQNHPVVHVTYDDALKMAKWLSDINRHFLLPNETQWEYACRAQSNSSRFFGEDISQTCTFANVADQTIKKKYHAWRVHPCNDSFTFTAPAGMFSPNQFGLYDMLGNVWEWCINAYVYDAYLNPKQLLRVHNDQTAVSIRGGSWYTCPQYLRCANRDFVAYCKRRSSDLGFRLIMK